MEGRARIDAMRPWATGECHQRWGGVVLLWGDPADGAVEARGKGTPGEGDVVGGEARGGAEVWRLGGGGKARVETKGEGTVGEGEGRGVGARAGEDERRPGRVAGGGGWREA